MKHIAGWLRRNNTLMAQAKDLARQLQEAWDDTEMWEESYYSVVNQLHRVARERDEERGSRLAAEAALADILDNEEE